MLIGATVLSLAFAAPVAAASRQAELGAKELRPAIGVYTVNFSANWDISQTRDAGLTWWVVKKIQVRAVIVNGTLCKNAGTCVGPWLEGKAEFLNAAGTVVYTIQQLPNWSCWWDMQTREHIYLYLCKESAIQLSSSVNRIRFTVRANVYDGWWRLYRTERLVKTVAIS